MNPHWRSRRLPGIALMVAGVMLAAAAQARDAPAELVREAIAAARLHTTIDSLLNGNIERMMVAPRVADARPEQREALQQAFRGLFTEARALARVRQRLAADATAHDLRDFTAAFMSPLALRMQAIEDAAADARSSGEPDAEHDSIRRRLSGPDRIALMVRIDEAVQASFALTILSVTPSLAEAELADPTGPGAARADRTLMLGEAARLSRRLWPQMREQVIDHLLYTYQKASDEDLQAYVKLHEQPGAHTVLRLITQAIGAALIDMQRDAFELTARERRGGERF